MSKIFLLAISLCVSMALPGQSAVPADVGNLPVFFKDNLIYLVVPLPGRDSLVFYTDTGGKNFLYPRGRKKLGVKRAADDLWERAQLGDLLAAQGIPLPIDTHIQHSREQGVIEDGMLGRTWFADRTWQIDYLNQSLAEQKCVLVGCFEPISRLYFLEDSTHARPHHLPRLEIVVDRDTLSLLFDTGAQVALSTAAQVALDAPPLVATSFISSDLFDKWKCIHPEWEIIEKADRQYKEDMIRVPEIGIGNQTIGPVWFVKRDEQNFRVMSQIFMDKPIVGALGGNALSLLANIVVDYHAGWLYIFSIQNSARF